MNFYKNEFTLLSHDEVFSDKMLSVIALNGAKCELSDFAILLGGVGRVYGNFDENPNYYSYSEKTCPWYLSSYYSNRFFGDGFYMVTYKGESRVSESDMRYLGVRPALSYSNISDISQNVVIGRSGVFEVEYGEYPQYVVDTSLGRTLDSEFSAGRLRKTGKTYTTDSSDPRDSYPSFEPFEHVEFEYNGKNYVRVKARCLDGKRIISTGDEVRTGDIVWVEVSPIVWYVDDIANKLVSKTCLASGIRFCDRGQYKGDFKKTEMYTFLNEYFAKDIIPSKIKTSVENLEMALKICEREVIDEVKDDGRIKLQDFYSEIEKEMLDELFGDNEQRLISLSSELSTKVTEELHKLIDEALKKQIDNFSEELEEVNRELSDKIDNLKLAVESKDGVIEYVDKELHNLTEKHATLLNDKLKEYISSLEEHKNEIILQVSNFIRENFVSLKNEFDKLEGNINAEISKLERKKQELTRISADVDRELERIAKERRNLESQITNEVIRRVVDLNPVKEVTITIDGVKKKGVKGLFHQDFEAILQLVSLKMPIFLVGPAGCGKNVILKQCSEVLGKKFYYQNDADEDYKLLGFVDAGGIYHKTPFYDAFKNGGILMLDEMDNSNASVLLKLNSAIGSGNDFYMTFPNGETLQAHKDFQVVAAANTYGTGSSQIYCGRNQIDGATLDRYYVYNLDYDKNLEKALVNNKEILGLFWNIRDIVKENDIRHTVSTRAILNMDKIVSSKIIGKGSFTIGDAFDGTLIKGLDVDDLNIIVSKLSSSDKYSLELLKHLKNKYGVDRQEYKNKNVNDYDNRTNSYGYGSSRGWGGW